MAGLILMLRLEVADCDDGCVESVTLMVTDAVPMELCTGVPVIAPVALFMDKPAGKPATL
jgi:hypothetical protein